MINITTGKLVLWALVMTAIYILASYFVPRTLLISVLNGMFLGVAGAVTIVYAPLVFFSLRDNNFGRGVQLSVGIALLWLSLILSRAWAFYYRHLGSPAELLQSPVIGYFILLAFVAGCLFVTAPGYVPPIPATKIPFGGRNRILLLLFAIAGGIVGVYLSFN